jgi:hypothetical protein
LTAAKLLGNLFLDTLLIGFLHTLFCHKKDFFDPVGAGNVNPGVQLSQAEANISLI